MKFKPDDEVVIKRLIVNGNEHKELVCKVIGYKPRMPKYHYVMVNVNTVRMYFKEDELELADEYFRRKYNGNVT